MGVIFRVESKSNPSMYDPNDPNQYLKWAWRDIRWEDIFNILDIDMSSYIYYDYRNELVTLLARFLQVLSFVNNNTRITVTWSCSPKLSVSGESWSDAIQPSVASSYASVNGSDLYLKFVVANRADIEEAGRAVQEYRDAGIECPVYCMPLGGRSEEYNMNVQEVAEICMERGWRFTPRLHISLFGNAWGT